MHTHAHTHTHTHTTHFSLQKPIPVNVAAVLPWTDQTLL